MALHVPHVTVGAHPHLDECDWVAGQINAEHRVLRAVHNSVAIVEVGESMVRTVAEINLKSGGSEPVTAYLDDGR